MVRKYSRLSGEPNYFEDVRSALDAPTVCDETAAPQLRAFDKDVSAAAAPNPDHTLDGTSSSRDKKNKKKTKDPVVMTEQLFYRIHFGSCNQQGWHNPFWNLVLEEKPNLLILMGDSIYADDALLDSRSLLMSFLHNPLGPLLYLFAGYQTLTPPATPSKIRDLYRQLKELDSGFKAVLARKAATDIPLNIIGIWDDHDTGIDAADRHFPYLEESRELFLEFIDEPLHSIRRDPKREGLYYFYDYEIPLPSSHRSLFSFQQKSAGRSTLHLRVILLDLRSAKDSYGSDRATGQFLSEKQWEWFEKTLSSSDADVNLIVSSIQAFPIRPVTENWSKFPNQRKRLLNLLLRTPAKAPILLSGDVHFAEVGNLRCTPLRVDFNVNGEQRHLNLDFRNISSGNARKIVIAEATSSSKQVKVSTSNAVADDEGKGGPRSVDWLEFAKQWMHNLAAPVEGKIPQTKRYDRPQGLSNKRALKQQEDSSLIDELINTHFLRWSPHKRVPWEKILWEVTSSGMTHSIKSQGVLGNLVEFYIQKLQNNRTTRLSYKPKSMGQVPPPPPPVASVGSPSKSFPPPVPFSNGGEVTVQSMGRQPPDTPQQQLKPLDRKADDEEVDETTLIQTSLWEAHKQGGASSSTKSQLTSDYVFDLNFGELDFTIRDNGGSVQYPIEERVFLTFRVFDDALRVRIEHKIPLAQFYDETENETWRRQIKYKVLESVRPLAIPMDSTSGKILDKGGSYPSTKEIDLMLSEAKIQIDWNSVAWSCGSLGSLGSSLVLGGIPLTEGFWFYTVAFTLTILAPYLTFRALRKRKAILFESPLKEGIQTSVDSSSEENSVLQFD